MAEALTKTFTVVSPLLKFESTQHNYEKHASSSANHSGHNRVHLAYSDSKLLESAHSPRRHKETVRKLAQTQPKAKTAQANGHSADHRTSADRNCSPRRDVLVSHRSPRRANPSLKDKTCTDADKRDRQSVGKSREKDSANYHVKRSESTPICTSLSNVKRRLAFEENDDEENEFSKELDFTEKLAALRSLISAQKTVSPERDKHVEVRTEQRESKSSHRTSRKAVFARERPHSVANGVTSYNRDVQSERRPHSRSRERDYDNDTNARGERQRDDRGERQRDDRGERQRDDRVERQRESDGTKRISALSVDIQTLKEGLEQRHKQKSQKSSDISPTRQFIDNEKQQERTPPIIRARPQSSLGLKSRAEEFSRPHTSLGSRISSEFDVLTKFEKRRLKEREPLRSRTSINDILENETEKSDSPERKLNKVSPRDHPHNRSIQSNVPLFEPESSIRLDGQGKSNSRSGKKRFPGFEDGMTNSESQLKRSSSTSLNEAKQSNVVSYVGTSLTPEKVKVKDKVKSESREKRSESKERERFGKVYSDQKRSSKVFKEMKPSKDADFENLKDFETDNFRLKDAENKKRTNLILRHKEESISAKLHRVNKLLKISSDSDDDLESGKSDAETKTMMKPDVIERPKLWRKDSKGMLIQKEVPRISEDLIEKKRKISVESKVEEKVLEWIESTQQTVRGGNILSPPSETEPLSAKEFNFSPSHDYGSGQEGSSPRTDSCDKVPVKLEKNFVPNGLNHVLSSGLGVARTKPGLTAVALGNYGIPLPKVREEGSLVSFGSRSLAKERNRLELEFPVKDGSTSKAWRKVHDSVESIAIDSASSVFSLPFSVRSTESVSTTVQAVKLLRKLYGVDADQRQDLVLMAKCFRRWLNNVLRMKERDLHITDSTPCNPISYGVMLRKSEIFYRTCLLNQTFEIWQQALTRRNKQNAVASLHRRHTLQKGMNALKWAINRTKLRQGILQDRVNSIVLVSSFMKWRTKTEENRRQRLQAAFIRWRQFTKESQNPNQKDTPKNPIQRIRLLRTSANNRLKQNVFQGWCQHFESRMKQHKADTHFRLVLLSQGWQGWKIYTLSSKEKKQREKQARELYERNLQRKMFRFIEVEFIKYTKAKRYQKASQLKTVMFAWVEGTKISQAERAADMRVAEQYWARATVRACFTAWHESLLNKRACRMSHRILTKHAFNHWNTRCQKRVKRRADVELYIQQRVMSRAVQHWHFTVTTMKKRRAAAVVLIHTVLQRYVIQRWQTYTLYQRALRQRLELHLRKKDLLIQSECLTLWYVRFQDRCDLQRAQQFWSNTCARKAVQKWKLICRKRSLKRLLEDTEPLRQLEKQRVIFERWQSALGLIDNEKKEASDVRSILQLSLVRTMFEKWRLATEQLLTIKPTVLRHRQELISRCFHSWQEYVTHKADCSKSEALFKRVQLRNKFSAWRRHYLIHQLEKDFTRKLLESRARMCVQSWRFFIQRKHSAQQFHQQQLLKMAFYHWSTSAATQIRQKKMEKTEMETVNSILRQYFDTWRRRWNEQHEEEEAIVKELQEKQESSRTRNAFIFWRRHFRATLVARENEKIRIRRLAKQALCDWHQYTQTSMSQAVKQFATAIGLVRDITPDQEEEEVVQDEFDNLRLALSDSRDGQDQLFEPMNFGMESPRTSSYKTSPRVLSSFGTPLKRMFSPSISRQGLSLSMEVDNTNLINNTFLDARFEMEQAVKTESRREIVVTVVSRLRNWPISIVFETWRDYTAQQVELKKLTGELRSIQVHLIQEQFYRTWVKSHTANKIAKLHRDQVMMRKALLSLYEYSQVRKQKKQLSALAQCHFATRVYRQVFPMWLVKAQEKSHREHIIHLWGNITSEEQALIPRERSFRYNLNRKSVTVCFKSWLQQYRKITALKRAYQRILYNRYFSSWHTWAHQRHEQRKKSTAFREDRVKKLVFKTWCLRHNQKTEVAQRYHDTWNNYLGVILVSWHTWAHGQRTRNRLGVIVQNNVSTNVVSQTFYTWRTATQKQLRIKQWYQSRLLARSMAGWQAVAIWQKNMRKKVINFQVYLYTRLAKHAFQVWKVRYQQRLQEHQEHEDKLHLRVLQMAQHWRQRAQTTRGNLLKIHLQKLHVQQYFKKWQAAYDNVLLQEDQLQVYVTQKNKQLMSEYLDSWRTALLGKQVQRLFNMKLLAAFLQNWKITAKACKERRLSMQTYVKQRSEVKVKGLFSYWSSVTKVRKSIRGHANLRIQLTAFKGWLMYTRRQQTLQRLEKKFVRQSNQQVLQKYWYMVKYRFEYCVALTETARKVQQEKNLALMRSAMDVWTERLKRVIAGECYRHMLAKRVARNWCRLVQTRRAEREHERKQTALATRHCNKKLCKLVFGAWFDEVLIVRQIQRHKARLMSKFWGLWKLRVDMMVTAKAVHEENLYGRVWKVWHMAFVKQKAIQKMVAFERKQSLTMVLVSWRNLVSKKRRRRISQIPLPISPALNMPSSGSSGSLSAATSTEELSCSSPIPTYLPQPSRSQIPISGVKIGSSGRNKVRPGSLGIGGNSRSNMTHGYNGRNTPTSPSGWK